MMLSVRDFPWEWCKKPYRNKTQCYSLEKWDFFKELDLLTLEQESARLVDLSQVLIRALQSCFSLGTLRSGRKKSTHRISASKWLQTYVVADTPKETNPLSVTSALGSPLNVDGACLIPLHYCLIHQTGFLRQHVLEIVCPIVKSCLTLGDPTDYSPPGSSVHGIFQARILEWVAISFSRGSSWPRVQTCISCIGRWTLYHWATWVAHVSEVAGQC